MIVSNEHKFIYFFSVGNTASRTVNLALAKYHDDDLFSIRRTCDWSRKKDKILRSSYSLYPEGRIQECGKRISREISPAKALEFFKLQNRESQFWEYKKIATVRNPYSLLFGCCNKNFSHHPNGRHLEWTMDALQSHERYHGIDDYNLYNGQYGVYSNGDGTYLLNDFVKFENLELDLKRVLPDLQIKLGFEGKTDEAPERLGDAEAMTKKLSTESIEKINKWFGRDFKEYGYRALHK